MEQTDAERMVEIRQEMGRLDILQMEQRRTIARAQVDIAEGDVERAKLIFEFDTLRARETAREQAALGPR